MKIFFKRNLRSPFYLAFALFLYANCSLASVTPSHIHYKKDFGSESQIFLMDQLFVEVQEAPENPEPCYLLINEHSLEGKAQKISKNIVACTFKEFKTLEDLSAMPSLSLSAAWLEDAESLSLSMLPEGKRSPIAGSDQAMYLINPQYNIIHGALTFNGRVTKDSLKQLLLKMVQDPKLVQFRSRPHMQGDEEFWVDIGEGIDQSIEDHMHFLTLDQDVDSDLQLEALVRQLTSLPISESRPVWQAWLVSGVKGSEQQEQSTLIIRSHHIISDGIGLVLSLFRSAGIDVDKVEYPGKKLRTAKKSTKRTNQGWCEWSMNMTKISFILLANFLYDPLPMTMWYMNMAFGLAQTAYNMFLIPAEPFRSPLRINEHANLASIKWLKKPISVQSIKEIGKSSPEKASFNDVIYTLISGAVDKTISQGHFGTFNPCHGDLHTCQSISLRSLEDMSCRGSLLSNRVASVRLPLLCGEGQSQQRLNAVHDVSTRLLSPGVFYLLAAFSKLTNSAPKLALANGQIQKKLQDSFSVVFSTVPGPVAKLDFAMGEDVYSLDRVRYFLPPGILNRVPIIFTVFSYRNLVEISVSVADQLDVDAAVILDNLEAVHSELTVAGEKKNQ